MQIRSTSKNLMIQWALIVIAGLAVLMPPGQAYAVSVHYGDFSDISAFTFTGAAADINAAGPVFFNGRYVLRLTDACGQSGTYALLTDPVPLVAQSGAFHSFSTAFQFQITGPSGSADEDGPGADGIWFEIVPRLSGATSGIAVEFDTFRNAWDISGNHAALIVNGNTVAAEHVPTPMNNGSIWRVWINYNAATKVLEVRLAESDVKPDAATLSYTVDIPSVIESTDAYFGFRGYTGTGCEVHDVRSWDLATYVLYDDFDDNAISSSLWSAAGSGAGPAAAETNQRLEISLPAGSYDDPTSYSFSSALYSMCALRGDFDVQVDYHLLTWPSANGVRVGLGVAQIGAVERVSFGTWWDFTGWPREVYLTHFTDGVQNITSTTDTSGRLRMVRTNDMTTGYYSDSGEWRALTTSSSTTADATFSIAAWSHDYAFTDQDVKIAFDNFIINEGQLVCPTGAPSANAGPDQTVELTSCAGASVTFDGSGSSDPNGDALTYTWTENGVVIATGANPVVTLSYGSHTITLTVDDGKGGTATDDVVVNIVDTTAPSLNVTMNPNTLWPPNRKYVTITPAITLSDACTETTAVALVSAVSSEPDNGLGDGDTENDIVTNPDGTISLRAERSGKGGGRVYTITYQATDAAGNSATATATVTVPHNR